MSYKRTSPMPVIEGGTGTITNTNHGVLLGQAASAIVATSAGATGTVLIGTTGADPSFSATPTVTSITISNAPSAGTDGTNKTYVDAIASGIEFKSAVYAGSTAALNASYNNGVAGVGAFLLNTGALAAFTIDGTTPPITSRILVKDQASTLQNGIYTLTTVGSGAIAWILTRALDYDQPAEIQPGDLVPVINGTVNADTLWLETATVATIGTDPIIFTQFAFGPNKFASSFATDSGTATVAAGSISVVGGSNINTSGATSIVTVNLNNSPSVSGSVTAGTGLTATTGGITATGTSSINASGAGNNSIGTGTNSGTISIGNTNSAAVSIDSGTAGITIGTTANAHATTVGSTNSTSSTTLQSGSGVLNITATGGALTINSGVGVLAISNDASATTVNIGTGGAAKTVTLGSTNTTSTTTIQAGSGGVKLGGAAEGTLVTSSAGVISTVTGTAGFVLTANAAGTSPSFQTAPGGGVLTASVNLTNAQIKAIHATPITIVAAQGAGTTIQLISCAAKLHYGGTNAFVDGSAFGLSFYYTNNAGVQVGSVMTSTVLTQTSNRIYLSNQILATNIDTSFENLPVVVTGATATEITGNAANNNTITVNITYKVITL